MSFQSAWSTNAVSICRSCGLGQIRRLEQSRRFLLRSCAPLSPEALAAFAGLVRFYSRAPFRFCRLGECLDTPAPP